MKTYFPKGIWCQAFLRLFLAAGLLVTLVFLPQRTVRAAVVRYAKPDGALLGTCNSWANACILQAALNIAAAGDAVWVKAGTYFPTSGTDRSLTFQLKNGVGILGGFAGDEASSNKRDPVANVTTLSGNIGNPIRSSDNSYHVVNGSGTDASAVLDGFTISGGNANGPGVNDNVGGGMYNDNGSPTLTGIIFSGSSAQSGGGMYNHQSSPVLNQVSFNNNTASYGGGLSNYTNSAPTLSKVSFTGNSAGFGGGMYSENCSPVVNNTTFSNNTADYGGGMAGTISSPSLGSVTFSSNSATYYGGGLYAINNSNPVITDGTFESNSAAQGGGMYASGSSPTLSNVSFTNNSAKTGGGMLNESNSNTILTNGTFTGNSAVNNGGGVRNTGSSPTITNAYFNDNTADYGGGMDNNASSPALSNVTFNSNSAAVEGGGMYNWGNSSPALINLTFRGNSAVNGGGGISNNSANPDIKNSILWGNTAALDPQIHNTNSSAPGIIYSDIQGGYAGEGNTKDDPLLGILGTYGGSTQVFPLLPGSAAIDSGRNVFCASTDQRGISRPQGSTCDMGAFESRGFTLSISAGDNQSAEINSAFTQALAVSISSSHAEPVNGGSIHYSVPSSGASAVLSASFATVAAGAASLTAMSNATAGAYQVTAHAAGAALPAIFHLTNTLPPCTACIYLPLIFKSYVPVD